MPPPTVSVVIPAFNAAQTISRAISATLKQDYNGLIEVIVVDDGSTDETAFYTKQFPKVRYFYQRNAGPACARNAGAGAAQGEYVAFTDADCVPEENWLSQLVTHFDKGDIAVVAGSYGIINPESLLARCIHKEIIYRHHRRMPDFPKSFGSYNFCIKMECFKEVGGFNARYRYASGEDNDLSYKLLAKGYRIFFAKEAMVRHFHPVRARRYLHEQWRHGFWRAKMYCDHPAMARGDDYTFWKDIVEPVIVLLVILALFFCALDSLAKHVLLVLLILLLGVEVFFGFCITKNVREGIFISLIMFLRSFARTLGFLLGFPAFFSQKLFKKN